MIKIAKSGDTETYTNMYDGILAKLDPQRVLRDLNDAIVLCWEKPGKFCHRHLVAKWLEKETGLIVKEI